MLRLEKCCHYRFLLNNLSCRCLLRRYIFFCILFCGLLLLIYNFRWQGTQGFSQMTSLMVKSNFTAIGLLVSTKFCHIPDIDPFESSVKTYFSVSFWKPCAEPHSLTYQNGSILRLNHSLIKYKHGGNFNCCKVVPIRRLDKDDHSFEYLPADTLFNNDIKIKDEFIKVQCYGLKNDLIYTNFHAFIHKKTIKPKENVLTTRIETMLTKINKNSKKTTVSSLKTTLKATPTTSVVKNPVNILLVGIDSMSRLNFLRQMQMTHRYILKLGAIGMLGYNKVADNTFVNLIPLLTGKYLEELPWNETLSGLPLNKYNFLWKRYKNHGFTTLFAEDDPPIGTFNYLKFGFKQQPTDHYYRPFALAMEEEKSVWTKDCVRDRTETGIILQYIYDFARVYKDSPYFSLSFIGRLTHDDINKAGRCDAEYYKFFKTLNDEQLLNNTLVVFFSDHGIRFGSFRKTYVGRLEERLPFMFIIPPPFFKHRYPNLLNNIKINSRRLTTPFDIHETLVDALHIEKANLKYSTVQRYSPEKMKSISLFSRVPEERSCKRATILSHWCACHQTTAVTTSDDTVIYIAEQLVKMINNLTSEYRNVCSKVRLSEISEASMIKANDEMMRFQYSHHDVIDRYVAYGDLAEQSYIDYQITISTLPGKGLFDATVRYQIKDKSCTLVGGISRTNKYGSHGNCIAIPKLQPFCYCHKSN
ncbi:uncharacterized protein LOC115223036 isoform X2 [Octopus sinensis]|uniref:Uncharacterized protein LOC115223036 isoform X2 n=1 Tax=Octopus sinensis TaxID=2607531 RepID=A0A6P7TJQ1_9MOLL|nr:uncharacterized protein LOC115223036 isoform X2 [Octopus sinensis]